MPYPIRNDFDAILVSHADVTGAAGFRLADIVGIPNAQVVVSCERLIRTGKLWKGKISHRIMRIFSRPEWAANYSISRAAATQEATTSGRRNRAPWAADAAPHFPVDSAGRPLYVVTVCPPVTARAGDPIRTANYVPY